MKFRFSLFNEMLYEKYNKKMIALSVLTIFASAVNATIIDHGDYLTDTNTGLDWLDVSSSVGMSFNEVSSQMGVGGQFEGWRWYDSPRQ